MTALQDSFWDRNGFDELRKVIRCSQEFCKDASAIFAERAEIELSYSKAMAKLSVKASKVTKNSWGTMHTAWETIVQSFMSNAEAHRILAEGISTELSKPFKARHEQIVKDRKPVEAAVEKAMKNLADCRSNELKTKQNTFSRSRELEQAHEQLEETHGGTKPFTDKDIAKLEQRVKKAEELSKKADSEYVENCKKAEQARQMWEQSMYLCGQKFEEVERSRTEFCKEAFVKYEESMHKLIPDMQQSCDTVAREVGNIDASADITTCCETNGTGPNVAEQLLYECWEEDTQSASMNSTRRAAVLQDRLGTLEGEVDKAHKVRKGIESLLSSYKGTPSFGGETAQEDLHRQICSANAMVDYFEACLYKVSCALSQVNNSSKPYHRLGQFIASTRSKQGVQVSVLRVPLKSGGERDTQASNNGHTGAQEAAHAFRDRSQSFYDDEDEFDAEGPEQSPLPTTYEYIGQCRALYDYQGTDADELTLFAGNVLNIISKNDENWWHGELNGKIGLFPATYIEEM